MHFSRCTKIGRRFLQFLGGFQRFPWIVIILLVYYRGSLKFLDGLSNYSFVSFLDICQLKINFLRIDFFSKYRFVKTEILSFEKCFLNALMIEQYSSWKKLRQVKYW